MKQSNLHSPKDTWAEILYKVGSSLYRDHMQQDFRNADLKAFWIELSLQEALALHSLFWTCLQNSPKGVLETLFSQEWT